MMRSFVLLSAAGLVLVPDWASAFGQRPCYAPPWYAYPPPVVYYVVPAAPAPSAPLPPPKVTREPAPDAGRSAEVRPADFATPAPATPTPAPATPTPAAPPPEAPKPTFDLKLPESATPDVPKLQAPQVPPPKVDPPKPAADAGTIPPLIPRLPGTDTGFPPLNIPTGPVTPSTSTSKSSPLSAGPTIDVYPVDGAPPATPAAKRTVGFFNHTDRDVRLTVEGSAVTLPRRHHVSATVPATFRWRLDDGAERTTAVPTAAPGVEVVLRTESPPGSAGTGR